MLKTFFKFFCSITFSLIALTLLAEKTVQVPQLANIKLAFDGIPNETFWKKAAVIGHINGFRSNKPAKAKTKILLCADRDRLYFALLCDEPAGVKTGKNTDSVWSNDNVELLFGQARENDWYRQIAFGLNGQKTYNEFISSADYQFKVNVKKKFWSAEIVIDRNALGCQKNDTFGFNLFRTRAGGNELQSLSDIVWGHDVAKFKKLKVVIPDTEIAHGPWTFNITDNSAGIAWDSKAYQKLFIRKANERNFREVPVVKDKKIQYAIIKNLEQATRYEYRIGNGDIQTFETMSLKPADFTFTMTTDIHCRAYSLAEILNRPDVKKSDIFFCLGDMVTSILGYNLMYDGFLDALVKNWNKACYVIRGNHEYRGNADIYFEMFAPHTRQSFCAFTHKGVYFLLLDSDGDFKWTAEYEKAQKDFLRNAVHSKEFKEAQFRVILMHKPLFPHRYGGGIKSLRMISELPKNIIQSIDLCLGGHKHSYNWLLPGAKTMHSTLKSIHGKPVDNVSWPFPAITSDVDGYVVVQKDDKSLKVTVVGGNKKVLDTFTVNKK